MSQFKKGDPRPIGYNASQEWASVQYNAGLRQVRCGKCGLFNFPQELSDVVVKHELGVSPVCNTCQNER